MLKQVGIVAASAEPQQKIKPQVRQEIEPVSIDLEARVLKLEQLLAEHKHLGQDGSSEFNGTTQLNVKGLDITGAGVRTGDFLITPLNIKDGTTQQQARQRLSAIGLAVLGEKESPTETIYSVYATGKVNSLETAELPLNKADFTKINYGQTQMTHLPQSEGGLSAPTLSPPVSALVGLRTPLIENARGTITQGGNTLSDSTARFAVNSLVGGSLNILSDSSFLEGHRIISNTTNTITIDDFPYGGDGVWALASGTYEYQVAMPIHLGFDNVPFYRLNLADAIVLGVGNSLSQKRTIKWGVGSPQGVVTANIGSLFTRFDGTAGNTLYVKSSSNGANTGWEKVTTTAA